MIKHLCIFVLQLIYLTIYLLYLLNLILYLLNFLFFGIYLNIYIIIDKTLTFSFKIEIFNHIFIVPINFNSISKFFVLQNLFKYLYYYY